MTLYQAVGHRVGSSEALGLGHQLSSWHDRMVAHERALTPSLREGCDDTRPHAESIELWQAALQTLGEAAGRLTFLNATAARALESGKRFETAEQRRPLAALARQVSQ